eukprot:6211328-Pleurochrysis_carterae.AAC.1
MSKFPARYQRLGQFAADRWVLLRAIRNSRVVASWQAVGETACRAATSPPRSVRSVCASFCIITKWSTKNQNIQAHTSKDAHEMQKEKASGSKAKYV